MISELFIDKIFEYTFVWIISDQSLKWKFKLWAGKV